MLSDDSKVIPIFINKLSDFSQMVLEFGYIVLKELDTKVLSEFDQYEVFESHKSQRIDTELKQTYENSHIQFNTHK
jgi:hypothetical protein